MTAKSDAMAVLASGQANREVVKDTADADSLKGALESMLPQLNDALAASIKKMGPEFIVSTALTLLRSSEALRSCTKTSIIHGIFQASQLGLRLDPALGQAALVPKKVNGVQTAVFMPMYKGLLLRARRSGQIVDLAAQPVYANDTFSIRYGTDQKLEHSPCLRGDRGELVGVYAYFHLKDGGFQFVFLRADELDAFAKEQKAKFSGAKSPWFTHELEMKLKTVMKRLLRLAPDEDLQTVIAADDAAEIETEADPDVVVPKALPASEEFMKSQAEANPASWPKIALDVIAALPPDDKGREKARGWYTEATKRHKEGTITGDELVSIQNACVTKYPPKPVQGEQQELPLEAKPEPEPPKPEPKKEPEKKVRAKKAKEPKPEPADRPWGEVADRFLSTLREAKSPGEFMAINARIKGSTNITDEEREALLEQSGTLFKAWKAANAGPMPEALK